MSNYKRQAVEPADHAIGRSRGGLTTKLHTLVDGHGLPLVIEAGPGQGGDSPMLGVLLGYLRVARCGPGRPRTRPDALLGDKAYSSRAHRQLLRARGITAVIPERADQQGHRLRRGALGGRPVGYDIERYKDRTSSNGPTSSSSNGAALPPATTSSPSSSAAARSCAASSFGYAPQ